MKTVATHSGGFHADDVFAVATFQLLLGKENIQVIRTRDEAVIAAADYVVDVGGSMITLQNAMITTRSGHQCETMTFRTLGLV
jgi:uncharacterized UPF0160 family protein